MADVELKGSPIAGVGVFAVHAFHAGNAWLLYAGVDCYLVARRDIAAGEELTCDCNINIAGVSRWPCNCHAPRCRDPLRVCEGAIRQSAGAPRSNPIGLVSSSSRSIGRRSGAMDAYALELLGRREVEEVVVFGSFEADTYAPGSDLDVLIVVTESRLPVFERAAHYRGQALPVPLDLFVFTRAELEARAGTPFVRALGASTWRSRRA